MVNTDSIATATFPLADGAPVYGGTTRHLRRARHGGSRSASTSRTSPAGSAARCSRPATPSTRSPASRCTLVDNGMPVVVDAGRRRSASPATSRAPSWRPTSALRARLEQIRLQAGKLMNLGDVDRHDGAEADAGRRRREGGDACARGRSSPTAATTPSACSARSRWPPPRCCPAPRPPVASPTAAATTASCARAPDRHASTPPIDVRTGPARRAGGRAGRHHPHGAQADGRHRVPPVGAEAPMTEAHDPARPIPTRTRRPRSPHRRTPATPTATCSAPPTASRSPPTGPTRRPTPASTTSSACRTGSGCRGRCSCRPAATAPTTRRWSTPSRAAAAATPAWR